ERLDVLLSLDLPEVLVADPPRGIAVAGLLGGEDREGDAGRAQDLDERARDLLIAAVDRGSAPDEIEVLRIGPLGAPGHAEVFRPVTARFTGLAPGITCTFDVRHRALRLRRRRSLHELHVTAHIRARAAV